MTRLEASNLQMGHTPSQRRRHLRVTASKRLATIVGALADYRLASIQLAADVRRPDQRPELRELARERVRG